MKIFNIALVIILASCGFNRPSESSQFQSAVDTYKIVVTAANPKIITDYTKHIGIGLALSNGVFLNSKIEKNDVLLGNIENFQIAKDLQIESCSFQWSLELPNNAPNSRIFMPSSLGQIINDNCVVDHSKQTIEISPGNYSLHEFAVHVQANALKRLNSDLLHISARGLCGNESMIPGGSAIILEASNNIDNQQDILYTVDVLCSIAPTLQVQFLNIKKVGNYVDVVHSYSISDIISF